MQEERKRGRVCSGLDGIFPLVDCYLQTNLKGFFCFTCNVEGQYFTVACEPSCFDHSLEILDLKNICHFSKVGILENYLTVNPLNCPCTVVLLKTPKDSSTKALSRDVACYHETYFHKGQIRQEIHSMRATLSLPKIRVLRYTRRVENDLLWHCQDHLTRLGKQNSWCTLIRKENQDMATYEGRGNLANLSSKQIWLKVLI